MGVRGFVYIITFYTLFSFVGESEKFMNGENLSKFKNHLVNQYQVRIVGMRFLCQVMIPMLLMGVMREGKCPQIPHRPFIAPHQVAGHVKPSCVGQP